MKKKRKRRNRDYYECKGDPFFNSLEWQALRYRILNKYDGRCSLCGRGRHHRIVLHVDHIKPRAKYPELALVEDNLQVLCEDCNRGKGNEDETDWRKSFLSGKDKAVPVWVEARDQMQSELEQRLARE